jgi:pimeloyl-ACP methyl ester carboxylesterase
VPPANSASRAYQYSKDVSINYEIHGQGKPIVFLHGFGASLETWRDITPLLATDYTLYLLDMKGFGRSSKPKDHHYRADDQADIIRGFLRTIVKEPAALAGNSFGGGVALKTYIGASDPQVSELILIDAAAYPQRLPLFIAVLRWPILNRLFLQLPATWRTRVVLNLAFYDHRKITKERVKRHAQFLDLPGSHAAQIDTAKQLLPENFNDFLRQLGGIQARALILWGGHDKIIPVQNAERFHRDLTNSTLIIMDMGHVPQEEAPERTAEAIKNFLH